MARNFRDGPKWLPGKVLERTGPVSYKVVVNGLIWRCHVDQLQSYAGLTVEESVSEEMNLEDFPELIADSSEGGVEIREQVSPHVDTPSLDKLQNARRGRANVGTLEHTTVADQNTEGELAPEMPVPGLDPVLRSYPQRNRTQPNRFEPTFK